MVFINLGQELELRGYRKSQVTIRNKSMTSFTSPNCKLTVYRGPAWMYPFVSSIARTFSRDKLSSYDLAKSLGVIIPGTLCTSDHAEAEKFLERYGQVVVKPSESSASQGLTRDIQDASTLHAALDLASKHSGVPIIQEQFIGQEFRFTVIGGSVRSIIQKRTLSVRGNGIDSIQELISQENDARTRLAETKLIYPHVTVSMITEPVDPTYIPKQGERVELSKSTLLSRGASLCELLDATDRSYVEIAERLAAAINPAFIVVDLMIKDHTAPASTNNYVFLEYNTSPVTTMYGAVREGTPQNIVHQLADLIDYYAK